MAIITPGDRVTFSPGYARLTDGSIVLNTPTLNVGDIEEVFSEYLIIKKIAKSFAVHPTAVNGGVMADEVILIPAAYCNLLPKKSSTPATPTPAPATPAPATPTPAPARGDIFSIASTMASIPRPQLVPTTSAPATPTPAPATRNDVEALVIDSGLVADNPLASDVTDSESQPDVSTPAIDEEEAETSVEPLAPDESIAGMEAVLAGKAALRMGSLIPESKRLKVGCFWLSDITEDVPKNDYIIQSFVSKDWKGDVTDSYWSEEDLKDIPEFDPNYFWYSDTFNILHLGMALNEKVLLVGMPGVGKTKASEQYASLLMQPYLKINGKEGLEASSILGYPWATDGETVWKDGLLPYGIKRGFYCCFDEVFKVPAGIQMCLQSLYEKDGKLLLDDKPGSHAEKLITPDPRFRLVLTDNVRGSGDDLSKFAATTQQDTSTLDRINLVYELSYMPIDDEVKMICQRSGVSPSGVRLAVTFADQVRSSYREDELPVTLSPRGVLTAINITYGVGSFAGVALEDALGISYLSKLPEEDRPTAELLLNNCL